MGLSMPKCLPLALVTLFLGVLCGCGYTGNKRVEPSVAPAQPWAEKLERPGVENLHKVSADLYRGAQPTKEGFKSLKDLGVKTVICLRGLHSDPEDVDTLGMAREHIPMEPWHPETEDVVKFLKLVKDPSRGPFFVHCQRGSDRTGMLCAIYRIVIQGWTRADAIEELKHGGYDFAELWSGIVKYLETFDIDAVKKQAGIE